MRSRRRARLAILALAVPAAAGMLAAAMLAAGAPDGGDAQGTRFDVLLKGGTVYDGTGAPDRKSVV